MFSSGKESRLRLHEVLLRLRANHLWPAMHSRTKPFNGYPRNKVVADDYAMVMGSSHIEPMLRNNMRGAEWDVDGHGEWAFRAGNDRGAGQAFADRMDGRPGCILDHLILNFGPPGDSYLGPPESSSCNVTAAH